MVEDTRTFRLYENVNLYHEVHNLCTKHPVYKDIISTRTNGVAIIDEDPQKVLITQKQIKTLLNNRSTVNYSAKVDAVDTWIAVWYPTRRIQQINVDAFNTMLKQVIKDDRDTQIEEDDEYSEYLKTSNPMTVVHYPYVENKGVPGYPREQQFEPGHIDIEISFHFPNLDKTDKNRTTSRFLQNFRHVMTTALKQDTLEEYNKEILHHQCAVMRSAMTQEGSTCFLNAAFNVVRLSTHLSELLATKTQYHKESNDHLPIKCFGSDVGSTGERCKKHKHYMADHRNKRRHLVKGEACPYFKTAKDKKNRIINNKGEDVTVAGPEADHVQVLIDILDTYDITYENLEDATDKSFGKPEEYPVWYAEQIKKHETLHGKGKTQTDVVISNGVPTSELTIFKPAGYTLVASLIRCDDHVICGYLCERKDTPEPRVFDSNGYDFAYNWNTNEAFAEGRKEGKEGLMAVLEGVFVELNKMRTMTTYPKPNPSAEKMAEWRDLSSKEGRKEGGKTEYVLTKGGGKITYIFVRTPVPTNLPS